MAGYQVQETKIRGQRSICSMFTNSRIPGGRSGNGRSLPLMDFLNRKSEKRASLQGCVVDAGLTPDVIERLDASRRNDARSNKHFENREDCHGIEKDLSCPEPLLLQKNFQFSMSKSSQMFHNVRPISSRVSFTSPDTSRQAEDNSECRALTRQLVSSTSKSWRSAQAFAEPINCKLNESLEDSTVKSHAPDRSSGQVQISPKLETFNSRGSSSIDVGARYEFSEFLEQSSDGLVQNNDTHQFQSGSMNFVDLTQDEGPTLRGLGDKNHSHENTKTQRKRKRSNAVAAEEAMERCPVCNDLFPPHVLQAHVESELDALNMLGTRSEPEAYEAHSFQVCRNEPQENRQEDGSTWGRCDMVSECSMQFKILGSKSRPRQSLLVLGDEPKYRKPTFPRESKRPDLSFNHYADGAGWFDEGGVGIDVEAVGSACVWEGLGSMSFGGIL